MALIPIFILLGGLGAWVAWKSHQRTIGHWRAFAAEMGLEFAVGKRLTRPVIDGTATGLPIKIDTFVQRSGNNSTTYTRYRVGYPPLGLGLRLSRQGPFSVVARLFGRQDEEVGDEAFDRAFVVRTDDRSRLSAIMTPSVRSALLRLVASYPTAVITDSSVQVTRPRVERNPAVLRSTTNRLLGIGRLLASPTAGVTDDMVAARTAGDLAAVATKVRELIESDPGDVEPRIFEVETLAAAGDDGAAATRLSEVAELAPEDPDVAGWQDVLQAGQPSSRQDEALDTDARHLTQDLFGGEDLSFETRKKFNQKYHGRRVRWKGRVKTVTDTGSAPRFVVNVANVDNDLYGNTDIDIVVENPTGTSPVSGDVVTVAGTLSTIDPLMRNMYVTDATISR